MTADRVRSLRPALAALLAISRPCFKRVASAEHWERYIVGLITDLKRKSIEPIALAAGVAVQAMGYFYPPRLGGQHVVETPRGSPPPRQRTVKTEDEVK